MKTETKKKKKEVKRPATFNRGILKSESQFQNRRVANETRRT